MSTQLELRAIAGPLARTQRADLRRTLSRLLDWQFTRIGAFEYLVYK